MKCSIHEFRATIQKAVDAATKDNMTHDEIAMLLVEQMLRVMGVDAGVSTDPACVEFVSSTVALVYDALVYPTNEWSSAAQRAFIINDAYMLPRKKIEHDATRTNFAVVSGITQTNAGS
jgi:hypothetical protein